MKKILAGLVSIFIIFGFSSVVAQAAYTIQEDEASAEKADSKKDKKDEKKKDKTIAEVVKDHEKLEGLFTFYRDSKTGSLLMEIDKSQIGQEFIYLAFVDNAVAETRYRRGAQIAEDIISVEKYYDRIEFVKKNTNYYIDPDSTLANGGKANISDAVLASIKIKATAEDKNSYLINVDGIFLSEALSRISRNLNPKKKPFEQFSMGKLAKDKTKYTNIGIFPENINIRADYVYNNPKPYVRGGDAVIDARSITIAVLHTFLAVPDNDFVPRMDDARVGYFGAKVTDLNSLDLTPYRDLISRWRLVKKDPDAALSEPVKPITWWIENTTPVRYREIMREGILRWNSSFEKAGFKNAVVVKIQPDDAEWSADDVRYNVVRWSSSPNARGAFGPSYINPRTGEILGADVMFEQFFVSIYQLRGDILGSSSAMDSTDNHDQHNALTSPVLCSLGYDMQESMVFGRLALQAMGADEAQESKIIEQMLMELMLHEVGHTFGLNHNMKSSQLHSNADIHDDTITQGILSGSVMDYGALVIALPGVKQGDYFMVKPGPYDDWAIQFGYDPAIEGAAREVLLARSTEPKLTFGNDADDMRSPGMGIDPYVNIWDMTGDAMDFAKDQFDLVDMVAPKLKAKIAEVGESYAKLRMATNALISYKRRGAATIANYIGGVHVDRAVQGQPGGGTPYTPVSLAEQKKAMKLLRDNILAPNSFKIPSELLASSAYQRRGFDMYGKTEDPKAHAAILNVQKTAFNHLLHPVVMTRITDTALYGNQYNLNQMMSDLSNAVFADDLAGSVNSVRQNLQVEYVNRLVAVINPKGKHDTRSKAAGYAELKRIEAWVKKRNRGDKSTGIHRDYIKYLIESALDPRS